MAEMLTAKDIQDMLQVDRSTIYRMAENGRIPAVKVGKQWRFSSEAIDTWLNEQSASPVLPQPQPTVAVSPDDDLASLLSDQVRKAVHSSGYAFIGTKKPDTSPTPSSYSTRRTTEKSATLGKPELGREEANAYYLPSPDARVEPIILPLEVEGYLMHIQEILKDFERDYPELKFDALRVQGEVSGRALRVARQPVETKVMQRRGAYDDGLKRALQMALSIGGLRNTFPGLNLDSYDQGALDFSFAERPVFSNDKFDDFDEELAFWEAAKMAREAGLPLEIFLARNGWSEDDLAELEANPLMQARVGLMENLQ
jgi:excisionase family DNA binding protein